MRRNFEFLKYKSDFQDLYAYCNEAEISQRSDPDKSALHSRQALEYTVKAVYLLQGWKVNQRASLFELVNGEDFKSFIGAPELMMALHYIRRAGNNAADLGQVSAKESFFSLLNLYHFVGSVLIKLDVIQDFPEFDPALLSSDSSIRITPPEKAVPSNRLIKKYESKMGKHDVLHAKNPIYFSEEETRKLYIDQLLHEAGWHVLETNNRIQSCKACIEIEVDGMPNKRQKGYVDYVLFGRDGTPLALIEAKKTSESPIKGKHQASLYADCLEQRYGVRPVIYYTNGYQTHIIDGLGYPSRPVSGFHTIADLELLIQRKSRKEIKDFKVKESITDRYYQKSAIKAVCEHFNDKHRRALLVMATGTGKTRVAISMVELLMRNNWIKNVLFLADRTALVNQAHKNFTKLLPAVPTCVLSDKSPEKNKDKNARIVFSTYHTMVNYIDNDTKEFSVGRFDLILVDEAHRSIFGKFGVIFDYFDSLLVGLTATPRDEVDRNTYQVFQLEQGIPNFSYELDEAVSDGFLRPYRGLIRKSKHLNVGIKYSQLPDEEKEQLEKVFLYESAEKETDDGEYHRDIASTEIFTYIFNDDTIDKVLQDLMENGLRVNSGEKIGKTILFAYNHPHAEQIVKRFGILYPQYGPDFCCLIDNYVTYAPDLIDKFSVREMEPQIAVSVDMLDTGIDVPDILNLVFFKVIKSKIKFLQMIGRGTRLSENIFGLGSDKKEFLIFDYLNNFEYFEMNPEGVESKPVVNLTQRIFCIQADLAYELQSLKYHDEEFAVQLRESLKKELQGQVRTLNPLHIKVRQNRIHVDKFKLNESWQSLTVCDIGELKSIIAPLVTPKREDEGAKKFDLMILNLQLSFLDNQKKATKSKDSIIKAVRSLQKKGTIPQIAAKIATINHVLTDAFWAHLSLDSLERVRVELRDLMTYLAGDKKAIFTVDIEDEVTEEGETKTFVTIKTYRQKVMEFIAENSDCDVIRKIRHIEPLSPRDISELQKILWEELGTKEDYEKYTSHISTGGNVAVFIRSVVGIDRKIAMQKFCRIISNHSLTSEQQEYIKTIVTYVIENGDITREVIVNESPFDSYDWQKIFGSQVKSIGKFVDELHNAVEVR